MGVFIFSIIISVVCIWASARLISLYFKVRSWNRIQATIISKKIELHKKVSSRNSPYAIRVEYRYNFNNKEYINNKVYLAELLGGQANYMESSAKRVLENIKDTAEIYVDPTDPQRSVLFCTGVGMYFFILFIGMISWLIGMSFL